MSKSSIVIVIFVIGVILGALFLDIWGAETNFQKALFALAWTTIFLIALFYADKDKEQ
tara:strand:+ start:513 stop:686 length:174 start_codon:yes stop_codon:yes gene_type:complete